MQHREALKGGQRGPKGAKGGVGQCRKIRPNKAKSMLCIIPVKNIPSLNMQKMQKNDYFEFTFFRRLSVEKCCED